MVRRVRGERARRCCRGARRRLAVRLRFVVRDAVPSAGPDRRTSATTSATPSLAIGASPSPTPASRIASSSDMAGPPSSSRKRPRRSTPILSSADDGAAAASPRRSSGARAGNSRTISGVRSSSFPEPLHSGAMAENPTWESDVVLADGAPAHLRPVRPDDDAGAARPLRVAERRIGLHAVLLTCAATDCRAARAHHGTGPTSITSSSSQNAATSIVAIARYDRVAPDEAEVAFTVRDEETGRGLATVLLEHLAVIARANGIHTFAADTLPDNSKMLGVFRAAGWTHDATLRRRRDSCSFLDRTERRLDRRGRSARATGRSAIGCPSPVARFDRGSRRQPARGHDRARGVPQSPRVRLPGHGLSGESVGTIGRRSSRLRNGPRHSGRG